MRRKTTGNLKIVHERYDPKKNAQAAEVYKVRWGKGAPHNPYYNLT